MTNLAQVGVLYVYIMLVILVIGLGFAFLRIIDWIVKWVDNHKGSVEASKRGVGKKQKDEPWIKLALVSATVLFISVFSLGVLNTLGAGEKMDHGHGNTTTQAVQQPPAVNDVNNLGYMQRQIDLITYQLYQIERGLR